MCDANPVDGLSSEPIERIELESTEGIPAWFVDKLGRRSGHPAVVARDDVDPVDDSPRPWPVPRMMWEVDFDHAIAEGQ